MSVQTAKALVKLPLCVGSYEPLLLADAISTEIIFGGESEIFAHFSVKNLIETGLMGEKSHSKM